MANVRPALNQDGSFRNYVSTRKAMSDNARATIEPLYAKLLELENTDGVEASEAELLKVLDGRAFNEVMDELQDS